MPFAVKRIGAASHAYFVSVSDGEFVENTQECQSCRTSYSCSMNRFQQLAQTAGPSLESLAEATFPKIYETFAERLALEQRVEKIRMALSRKFGRSFCWNRSYWRSLILKDGK